MLAEALENSHFVASAWQGDRLVGLVRVVSDDVTIAFIQDLVVDPALEEVGIVDGLLAAVGERYAHVRQKAMIAEPDDARARAYRAAGLRNTRVLRRMPLDAWVRYEGWSIK
jgi:rRNA processing protein Gar1